MNALLRSATTSWKTTVGGVVAFLAVLTEQLNYLFDDNVATNPDWNLIIAAGAILWSFVFSRDSNVTSEKAEAKK